LKILEQLIAATGKNYVHNTQTEHHLKMIVDSLQGKVRKLDNEIKQKRELRVKVRMKRSNAKYVNISFFLESGESIKDLIRL